MSLCCSRTIPSPTGQHRLFGGACSNDRYLPRAISQFRSHQNAAIPDSESARRLLRVIDAGLENDDEAARHGPPAPHCGVLGAFRYALGEPNGDTPTPWTLSPCMMYILDGLSNCCWWIDHEAMHALAFEQTVEPESIIACLVVCDHFHGSTDRSSNVRANPLHQLQELLFRAPCAD